MEKQSAPSKESKNVLELIEPSDAEVIEKLKALGLNFEYFINDDDKFVYIFNNVQSADQSAFWLDAGDKKIIYQALHFGEDRFCDPANEKEITPKKLQDYLSEKFPGAEKIIFSCCNPDTAKQLFEIRDDKIIFAGTGTGTYSTWYSSSENSISSVKNTKINLQR